MKNFSQSSRSTKDYESASLMIENHSSELLEPISEYDCSRSLLALQSWITESTELSLSDSLGIESGDMHRMTENANWLSYCLGRFPSTLRGQICLKNLMI